MNDELTEEQINYLSACTGSVGGIDPLDIVHTIRSLRTQLAKSEEKREVAEVRADRAHERWDMLFRAKNAWEERAEASEADLLARYEAMGKALEFYGDEGNHINIHSNPSRFSPVREDFGAKARAAMDKATM